MSQSEIVEGPDEDDGRLLDEQKRFYRGQAPRYDDWWQRLGQHDFGAEYNAEWNEQVGFIERAISQFGICGNVLEFAGGTGWWTQRLAGVADRLTVVDSSPEVLERNRARVGRDDIRYVVADIFDWLPEEPNTYDVVFFSFWHSHVPRHRLATFWMLVDRCLHAEGQAVFVDNRWDPSMDRPSPGIVSAEGEVQVRRLDNGSKYRVVKVFYEPADLVAQLDALGWDAKVEGTRSFVYGSASPRRKSGPR
jgi:SAM-dependent methyltransferase